MKLFVCYGTWKPAPRPGGHPCGNAYHALREAGWMPDIQRCYGLGVLPGFLNQTPGRKEVMRLTGSHWVPVLVTDEGDVISGLGRDRRLGDRPSRARAGWGGGVIRCDRG